MSVIIKPNGRIGLERQAVSFFIQYSTFNSNYYFGTDSNIMLNLKIIKSLIKNKREKVLDKFSVELTSQREYKFE